MTLTEAVSPMRRLAGLTAVETNASAAWDFAGDGVRRANKLNNTIEILMAFVDMEPPKSLFSNFYIYEYVCLNRAEMKVTCFYCFAIERIRKSYKQLCKDGKNKSTNR